MPPLQGKARLPPFLGPLPGVGLASLTPCVPTWGFRTSCHCSGDGRVSFLSPHLSTCKLQSRYHPAMQEHLAVGVLLMPGVPPRAPLTHRPGCSKRCWSPLTWLSHMWPPRFAPFHRCGPYTNLASPQMWL